MDSSPTNQSQSNAALNPQQQPLPQQSVNFQGSGFNAAPQRQPQKAANDSTNNQQYLNSDIYQQM
jgi:hypothetical protein